LAKINRSTTYSILQDFVRRHIATNIQENGSSVFQVVPFVQLVRALEEEIAHKQDLVKQLTDFIPHFDALGLKKKPVLLESYFGLERVKQLYADIIGKANEIYAYI
jgi:hypothetical protein